jgi:hypothetical protein
MMGGAQLIGSFLDEGEIDEFIIHMIPTFIGEGIPLIAPRHRLSCALPRVIQMGSCVSITQLLGADRSTQRVPTRGLTSVCSRRRRGARQRRARARTEGSATPSRLKRTTFGARVRKHLDQFGIAGIICPLTATLVLSITQNVVLN